MASTFTLTIVHTKSPDDKLVTDFDDPYQLATAMYQITDNMRFELRCNKSTKPNFIQGFVSGPVSNPYKLMLAELVQASSTKSTLRLTLEDLYGFRAIIDVNTPSLTWLNQHDCMKILAEVVMVNLNSYQSQVGQFNIAKLEYGIASIEYHPLLRSQVDRDTIMDFLTRAYKVSNIR